MGRLRGLPDPSRTAPVGKLSAVVLWSNRRLPRPELPRLRPRATPTDLTKVDFTELVPEPVPFLGQAAYIQLEFFESLARSVATAPTLSAKEGLSRAAGGALRQHHALIAELRRRRAGVHRTHRRAHSSHGRARPHGLSVHRLTF